MLAENRETNSCPDRFPREQQEESGNDALPIRGEVKRPVDREFRDLSLHL